MDRRTFLAVTLAGGLSYSLVALTKRLGWLDSLDAAAIRAQREAFERQARASATVEGSILSREGEPFTTASEPGKPGLVTDLAYASLCGYRTASGCSGLRSEFSSELFYSREEGGGQAPALVTTIDSELQRFCYDLIRSEGRGVCIVADADTGNILALASSHGELEFDANAFSQNFEKYTAIDGYLLPPWQDALPPGSTAKLLTATAGLLAAQADPGFGFEYDDRSGVYQGIRNASRTALGKLTLEKAAIASSNTYFAHLGEAAGAEAMGQAQRLFGVNSAFWKLGKTALAARTGALEDEGELIQESIGQGQWLVSPMAVMGWYGALATGKLTTFRVAGHLLLPDGTEQELPEGYEAETKELELPDCDIRTLRGVFESCAESYGLNVPRGTVYAKTGTAQCGGGHAVYLPFGVRFEGGHSYEAIVMREDTQKTSSVLKPAAQKLLEKLGQFHTKWEDET